MTKPLLILYVDDEPLLNMAFVETLKAEGHAARGALSGEECLIRIGEEIPDIIILDIMMKPMSGWDTLLKIKEGEKSQDIPVIMQTGKSLTLGDVLLYGDLIDDYLIKPVKLPDMLQAIDRIMNRNREIESEVSRARKTGVPEERIREYVSVKRSVLVYKRLLIVLSRIYPVVHLQDTSTDLDLPELKTIYDRYTKLQETCRFLHSQIQ